LTDNVTWFFSRGFPAWNATQPKPVFAEVEEDDEEEDKA
jgi:hypothetical protein